MYNSGELSSVVKTFIFYSFQSEYRTLRQRRIYFSFYEIFYIIFLKKKKFDTRLHIYRVTSTPA